MNSILVEFRLLGDQAPIQAIWESISLREAKIVTGYSNQQCALVLAVEETEEFVVAAVLEDLIDRLLPIKTALLEFIAQYSPQVYLAINVQSDGKTEHEIFNGYSALSGFYCDAYVIKFLAETGAQLDINVSGKFD